MANDIITELGFFGVDATIGALAENVPYDNTESGLNATNAQEAIDELAARPQGGGNAGGGDAIKMTDIDLIDKSVSGSASDWGTSATIVGYDKTFSKRSLLTQVEILVYQGAIGANVNFYLGIIDQRNWLLPRKTFTAQVTSLDGDISVIDLSALNIIAEQGEVLFMSPQKTTSNEATFAWSTSALIEGVKCFSTTNILTALTEASSRALKHIKISAKEIDTFLALAEDVERTKELVQGNTEAIARNQIIYDRVTGNGYRIVINNGTLGIKSTSVNKLLVLGHSFCAYGNTPGMWNCNDNRGMAATVAANDYVAKLGSILGASTVKKLNVAAWERTLLDYDYATNWKIDGSAIDDTYDAIVFFVGANIVDGTNAQAGYEEAIDYLKTVAPTADIFVANIGPRLVDARAAAAAKGVYFLDISSVTILGNYQGSYYIGTGNQYYANTTNGVYGHPSDLDMWNIAVAIASGMGYDQTTDLTHEITLTTVAGGTIQAIADKGVEGGVISIKCVADEGKAISALSVVDSDGTAITATQRTNDYGTFYTFIMPAKSVTITPTWTNA